MASPKGVTKAGPFDGYNRAAYAPKHRIIAASVGRPGSGTTSFWLSAPGPLVVFDFNRGLEGVIERFQDDKEIYVKEYDWTPTETLEQSEAIDLRDRFIEEYEHAIQHARTVVVDKESELWELFRYAEFGGPKDSPLNYPELNQRYRRIINLPKALDLNVGFIQGMKEAWVAKVNPKTGAKGAVNSGEWERVGFKELEGMVHINLFHGWHRGEDEAVYTLEVGKARGPAGGTIQGQTFEGLTFPEFAQLAFPESDESEWV